MYYSLKNNKYKKGVIDRLIDRLQDWIDKFNSLWYLFLTFILIIAGLYFSFRTRFVQLSAIKETFRLIFGRERNQYPDKKQGISSFQALAMSTASRVGTGNLAGVAIAIATGGPGAVFWMWITAIIGAASGFVESTLAQVYKVRDGKNFRGGPAYYMEQALNARWLGIIFAVLITFSFGFIFNSVQANTVSEAFKGMFNIDPLWIGLILAILVIPIIFGGVQRIAKVSATIVPIMALAYISITLFIIIVNFKAIPDVFTLIMKDASNFSFREVWGGGISAAMMNGIKRGLFSNEAGMGSAPNAAATAHVSHPVKQGLIQSFGVFVDTLFICSATAFIVLFSDVSSADGYVGIRRMQYALVSHVGDWAHIFIGCAIFLFAFTSLIGNYYYGQGNVEFITKNKGWMLVYRLGVVAMIVLGAVAKLALVWGLADLFMGFMAFINLIAIMLLGKVAFAVLKDYMRQRKCDEEPIFYADTIPDLRHAECWERSDNFQ